MTSNTLDSRLRGNDKKKPIHFVRISEGRIKVMQQKQLEAFKQWFTEYVRGFYTKDDEFMNKNIQLKECHTHRVCRVMRQLAETLKISGEDIFLAETIALFHDVGRFPQFKQHRTYNDTISENHCLLSLKVLAEHQLLECLSDDERAVIKQAIEFHGDKHLPELDERMAHFAKMIRDADKIDIFEFLADNYRALLDNPNSFKWLLEFPDTPECNPEIIDAILKHELVGYDKLKTINDAKLLQIGWIYDIYFDWSLKYIYDHGYLQAIIGMLPKTEEIKQVAECIMSYTHQRIRYSEQLTVRDINE